MHIMHLTFPAISWGRKRSDWRMYNGIFSGWVDHVIGLLLGLSSWEDDNVAWLTPAAGQLDPLW